MRIVFLGNHRMGVVCLERLAKTGSSVVAVVAHPDNQDPDEHVWYESVKHVALGLGLEVHQPENVNAPEFVDVLNALTPDVGVVVSFRQILKPVVIGIPRLGWINVHPSLLPRYRGRANLAWAILNGEDRTGVTVHYIDEGIDTGPIIVQRETEIRPADTVASVLDRVTAMYPDALMEALEKVGQGFRGVTQPCEGASYFGRRYPKDGVIDWTRSALAIHNLVRAVTHPYPGAFTFLNGRKLVVWEADLVGDTASDATVAAEPGAVVGVRAEIGFMVAAGSGALILERVQPEGEAEVSAWALVRRGDVRPGTRLTRG